MKKTRMFLNTREIETINKIIEENNIDDSFELISTQGSGIGSNLDIEFQADVNGRTAIITIPITTEQDW